MPTESTRGRWCACLILVDLELLVEGDRPSSLAAVLQLVPSLLEPLHAFLDELPLAVVRPEVDEEAVVAPLPSLQAGSPRPDHLTDERAHSPARDSGSEYLQLREGGRQRQVLAVQHRLQTALHGLW